MDNRSIDDNPDDLDMWHDALAGDEKAREDLLTLAARLAGAQMRGFTEDARNEVQQMVALSLLDALAAKFVPHSHVRGFLHWRARSQISTYLRTCVQNRKLRDVDELLDLAGYEESIFGAVGREEVHLAMEECLKTVHNSDHRMAFRRRFLHGEQPGDIAKEQGVPPGRLRVWLARAVATVRQCLERKLNLKPDSDS